jgi:hypothetical protein
MKKGLSETKKLNQSKKIMRKKSIDSKESGDWDVEIPPHLQVVNADSAKSSETEDNVDNLPRDLENDSEWNPGSSYLQRKLQSDNRTDGVAYRLRSRLVGRSERETEVDKAGAEVNSSPGNIHAQSDTSPSSAEGTFGHSYNLRSKVGTASGAT